MEEEDEEIEEEEEEGKTKKKKTKRDKGGIVELKRPIIFICNKIYDKAVLPLKEISLVVKIDESNGERLLKRLRHICK